MSLYLIATVLLQQCINKNPDLHTDISKNNWPCMQKKANSHADT